MILNYTFHLNTNRFRQMILKVNWRSNPQRCTDLVLHPAFRVFFQTYSCNVFPEFLQRTKKENYVENYGISLLSIPGV